MIKLSICDTCNIYANSYLNQFSFYLFFILLSFSFFFFLFLTVEMFLCHVFKKKEDILK